VNDEQERVLDGQTSTLDGGETAALVVSAPSLPSTHVRNVARELLEAFLRGRNPNTMHAYRKDLETLAAFLGVETAERAIGRIVSLSAGEANGLALRYRHTMVEQKLAPATVNRRLASMRTFVKLARMLGMITWTLEVEGVDSVPYRDTRGPGEEAVASMLDRLAARGDAKGVRDAAILRLLHDRVLRRGEVCSLDRDHYDPVRGLSILGKGRSAREWVSLPKDAKAAVEAWLELRGNYPGPLFIALDAVNSGHRLTGSSVYAIVRRLGDAVGARARPHGLRHTGITTALERLNGDVRKAAKFSRHKNVQTLMIYDDARTDVGGEVAELVAASSETEEPMLHTEDELRRAINIRILRGPKGGLRFVSYEIPAFEGRAPESASVGAKKALEVIDVFRRLGLPISDPLGPVESSRENSAVATYEKPKATSTTVLACARGHVFDDASREGCYCTRNECAAERGTFKPERRIEWRTR
jgi:integrase/recombinase XerC